jgi:cyclophilin family peptidyl-prolyl cis-trans isomerase
MKNRLYLGILALFFSVAAHGANPLVEMKTNYGNVTFELYPDKAPRTVDNFLHYVKSGFYNGTVFHRVVNKFIIQGGGYTEDLKPKPTSGPIPNEATNGLLNEAGTLAMARTRETNSATSQFFVNLDRNLFLNHYKNDPDYYGYCVFGKVVKGMDVVKKIGAIQTGSAGPFASDVPLQPVIIQEVAVVTNPRQAQPVRRAQKATHKKEI